MTARAADPWRRPGVTPTARSARPASRWKRPARTCRTRRRANKPGLLAAKTGVERLGQHADRVQLVGERLECIRPARQLHATRGEVHRLQAVADLAEQLLA